MGWVIIGLAFIVGMIVGSQLGKNHWIQVGKYRQRRCDFWLSRNDVNSALQALNGETEGFPRIPPRK